MGAEPDVRRAASVIITTLDLAGRSLIRLVVALTACVGTVTVLSLALAGDNRVDAALPLYATAVAAIALLEGRRFGDATLAVAIPLLGVARIAVVDENLRVLLYGVTLATAAAIFAVRALARGGRLGTGEGLVLIGSCIAVMRLVPWSGELAVAQAIVIAGVLVLALSLATREGLGAGALVVCLAVGFATPLEPMKAALFPILVATLLAVLRGPSPFSVAALVGSAAIAGLWAWPIAALVLAAGVLSELLEPVLERRSAPAHAMLGIAAPASLSFSFGALAAFAFSPESMARIARIARPARIAAVALGVAALVVRPSLGVLYMIAALAVVLVDELADPETRQPSVSPIPLVAAVFCAAMLSLAGFSGAVVSKFPLPLPLAGIVAVAAVAMSAAAARRSPAFAVCAAAIALTLAVPLVGVEPRGTLLDARTVLSPGEAYETDLPRGSEVRIELSGANVTALEPGAVVGSVEAIDRRGRVLRRDVAIGDIADWGFGRPGHHFAARNDWPPSTAAKVAGYGHEAFFGGSGTITISMPEMNRIRITAASSLPENGRLNVEAITMVSR